MRSRGPHPNDPDYGWGPPDAVENPVPADLVQFYREFKPGYWAFVCPCCRNVFAPGLGGMPDAFRAHVHDYLRGSGCFFNPKAASVAKPVKHADKAANF